MSNIRQNKIFFRLSEQDPLYISAQDDRRSRFSGFLRLAAIFAVALGLTLSLGSFLPESIVQIVGTPADVPLWMWALLVPLLLGLFLLLRRVRRNARHEKEQAMILAVLEGSEGARLISDPKNRTIYANSKLDEWVSDLGEANVDALKKLFLQDGDEDLFFDDLVGRAKGGQVQKIELPVQKQGQTVWALLTIQPIAGWPDHLHWRIDDITERREMEDAIHSERERLLNFMDNALVGFFSVDQHGRFVFANRTLARWLGSDDESIFQTKSLHDFLVFPPKNGQPYDLFDKGGARQFGELLMRGVDGREFEVSMTHAIIMESDQHIYTQSVVRDLTTEREMKEALKISEDRFQRFFEEAPIGIVLLDTDGKVRETNSAFARMVGVNSENLVGQALIDNVAAEDQIVLQNALKQIQNGPTAPVELKLAYGDENRKGQFSLNTKLYFGRHKINQNLILHFMDMSDQKKLEAQFAQSQKMQAVGQLAGGVAHDFNNLLTAMIGFCDLLLLRHKPGDPSFNDIKQIQSNAARAAGLVRQLLAFSRQQTLQPKIIDITDALADLSHLLRRLIGANVELKMEHGRDLRTVRVDQGQLEQVLINLVVNARDAMEKGGMVTVRTYNKDTNAKQELVADDMPAGQWVVIEVRDQGCGIPKENITRIFEPFFTTKPLGAGTGLGLSTVYGIVRQTGGYLHVESDIGKGTVFTIYLPFYEMTEDDRKAAEEQKMEEKHAPDLTGSSTILLVEDEEAVRKFSSRTLVNKGYEVIEADNGKTALERAAKMDKPVDLIISDVMMPEMDGPTMMGEIRKNWPDVKILFMSGYTEDRIGDSLGKNVFFLAKPFTLKQLAAKVKEVLEA